MSMTRATVAMEVGDVGTTVTESDELQSVGMDRRAVPTLLCQRRQVKLSTVARETSRERVTGATVETVIATAVATVMTPR